MDNKPIILTGNQTIQGVNGDIYEWKVIGREIYLCNLTGSNNITVHEALTKIMDSFIETVKPLDTIKPMLQTHKFLDKFNKQLRYEAKQKRRVIKMKQRSK